MKSFIAAGKLWELEDEPGPGAKFCCLWLWQAKLGGLSAISVGPYFPDEETETYSFTGTYVSYFVTLKGL